MTWICYRGIELSARIQTILLGIEIFTLALFAVVSLVKVYANNPVHSIHVSASWFNPFALGWGPLIAGGPAGDLHLLGMGLGGRGQRGVARPTTAARARPRSSQP